MNKKVLDKLSTISTSAGVYIMKNAEDEVIYVGKAKNLKNRVSTYFNNTKKHIKVQAMVNSVADFDYIVVNSEYDALAFENNLIKKYQPHYNILLKDSKTFPYLKINLEQPFPYFEITRKVEQDGAKYFGPFIGKVKAKEILNLLNSTFSLRECKHNITIQKGCKACLRKHLGVCLAPCENASCQKEYLSQVRKAIQYLNGKENLILDVLSEKMQKMITDENYEKAIIYRDNIKLFKSMHSKVVTEVGNKENLDVFSYSANGEKVAISTIIVRSGKVLGVNNSIVDVVLDFSFEDYILQYYQTNSLPKSVLLCEKISEDAIKYILDYHKQKSEFLVPQKGIKKQLLQIATKNAEQGFIKELDKKTLEEKRTIGAVNSLKNILNLKSIPKRIECYDISHISGVYKVASMVVFINGKPAKAHYRKFKIKEVEGNNDFESLKETLKRRLKELNDENNKDISFSSCPNLIIIDGGKGQLNSVMEVFEEYAGKYKNAIDVISLAKREEEIFVPTSPLPIVIEKNKMELQLVQRLRDEAHRFAITFHRSLRGKGMIKSSLDDIVGVGQVKKRALINHFETFEELENASIEQLATVDGINLKLAQTIYNHLHK